MIQITKEELKKVFHFWTDAYAEEWVLPFNQLLASKQQPQEQPPQKKVVEWEYEMKNQDVFYYTDSTGCVDTCIWNRDNVDEYRYKTGNCFHTESEAETKKKYDLLFADYCELIRQTNEKAGLVLDWGNTSQNKNIIHYSHYISQIDIFTVETSQDHNDKEYWLIPQEEILLLCREYFTDTELKAIATKNHKLLMEDNK